MNNFSFQCEGLYFVKWKGYPESQNTWEPLEHLECHEKLKEFYALRLKEREKALPGRYDFSILAGLVSNLVPYNVANLLYKHILHHISGNGFSRFLQIQEPDLNEVPRRQTKYAHHHVCQR